MDINGTVRLYPLNEEKMSVVKDGIDHISNNKKSELDMNVLAMMYKVGLGCEKDEEKCQALLPKDNDLANKWIDDYIHYQNLWAL